MPSASGSENGRPSSSKSAPAFSRAEASSIVRRKSGSPAQMYGMNPFRLAARKPAKQLSIRFFTSKFATSDAQRLTSTLNGRNRENAHDQRNLRVHPGREHVGRGALRLRAADLL